MSARAAGGAPAPAPPRVSRAGEGWAHVLAVVARIPKGRVASYGQVARIAGAGARHVGYALHAAPGELVPWHRVVNARGAISLPPGSASAVTQRLRLEREGVRFGPGGRIDLARFGWRPRGVSGGGGCRAGGGRHARSR
ncbi:MAG TPA: MGMT family protein [Candidatus Eisenbacteria bacterium]|nr:MGMT family protein [Candidatus Eisenbacteria bacterium]